ncbi:MAG: dTDP-4-dehydrorhamnose 3,5-epimerase [Acidobacteria bacterium]|nr:dTDP-4-dehydrorhamnose 3,5-epimerase [Acidobacteriota bacterium]
MRFTKTEIQGVWLIEPDFHEDARGRFFRAWCHAEFAEHGISFDPIQANMGLNLLKGTLRGMHYQVAPALEAKLVRCTRGSMFDVALDLRSESATYRKWYGAELTADNGRMLLVPEGCAHGYQALEDYTEMHYMASHVFAPKEAKGARFDDPAFGIAWPLVPSVISVQDSNWPLQKDS